MEIKNPDQGRFIMGKKSLVIIILILCVGLFLTGCPKKTVMKEEPSMRKEDATARERAEQAMKEQELKAKEEAAKRDLDKSLVAKKEPGIEGTVFESSLLKDIRFDFDRYDVRPQDTEILRENVALLKKYSNVKIQIEGHCDERGTTEYNVALGERRANSTKRYLLSLGISADRLSTISYGEEKPTDPGHTEDAWAKNRRAHFIILSK